MDLLVPRNDTTKIPLPHLPALPSIFSQLLPTPVPQLTYKPGVLPLIESFIHNWKLLHLERAAQREREIAENKLAQTQAQFKQMEELLLFGIRYEAALKEERNKMEMKDIEKQTAQANLIHQQLKNMMVQIEAQKAQLEFQHMMKELGVDGNGSSED